MALNIPEEKVFVTGNIKFDSEYPKLSEDQLKNFRKELEIAQETKVLVLGSSHAGEESLMINAFEQLLKKFPDLKLLIVPRHPERFNEVAGVIASTAIPFSRFSQKNITGESKIILIDAMGVLRQCYQVATIAIVAGSFVKHIGGHNILEPSWYGIPVIFGPYMHNQPDMVELIREDEAGICSAYETLAEDVESLLLDKEKQTLLGNNGLRLTSRIHGATAKTITILKEKSFL